METNENDITREVPPARREPGSGKFWILGGALVVALGANAYLFQRSNNLTQELAAVRDASAAQFSKLDAASAAVAEENRERIEHLTQTLADVHNTAASAHTAIKRTQADLKKQDDQIAQRIERQRSEITGELSTLKDDTSNKLSQVSTDVGGVKTDVDGVKTEIASEKTLLEQHTADLKRVTGDMGVMSGLIATNGKDLEALRALGDRNYYEFNLSKGQKSTRIGNVTVALKRVDAKRNRYTVDVLADDKTVEKKDKTINEPVQVYVGGSRQPDEIVVNQVNKDGIVGYLSTPKVVLSRR
jgi:DNA repair exonuclease SbcCD ATPase subunit